MQESKSTHVKAVYEGDVLFTTLVVIHTIQRWFWLLLQEHNINSDKREHDKFFALLEGSNFVLKHPAPRTQPKVGTGS